MLSEQTGISWIYALVAEINKYWADKVVGVMEMKSVCVIDP